MKRLLLVLIVLAFLPFQADAATTLVQTRPGNGGGYVNSGTVTFTSSVTAGSLIVVAVTAGSANTYTISDNRSNTYTLITQATDERTTQLYYAYNVNAGATTITIQFGGGEFADYSMIAREYSGLTTTNPLDQWTSGTDGGGYVQTHSSTSTGTTAQANELLVVACGSSGSTDVGWSAGSGYGNITSQPGFDLYTYGAMEDRSVTAMGTYSATCSTVEYVRGEVILATFKEASGPPPATIPDQGLIVFE